MLVRHPLESEEDAVIDLFRRGSDESCPHLEFSEERSRATYRRYLDTAAPTIFVVEHEREIIGFLTAYISDFTFADGFYVSQDVLYVRPDKRGTRAAAALLKTYNQWADRLGAAEVYTGVASSHRSNKLTPERTAKFLTYFGFDAVGQLLRRIKVSNG